MPGGVPSMAICKLWKKLLILKKQPFLTDFCEICGGAPNGRTRQNGNGLRLSRCGALPIGKLRRFRIRLKLVSLCSVANLLEFIIASLDS